MTPNPDERDAWDRFAAAALSSINPADMNPETTAEQIVAAVSEMADAMLAERRKRFPPPAEPEKPALEGEWIDWTGGECPVLPDEIVRVERRDGSTFAAPARLLRWQHLGWEGDVLRYRVVSP